MQTWSSELRLLGNLEPDAVSDLQDIAEMEDELTALVGRKVDLRTANDSSRSFRDEVLRSAEVQYV